VDKPAGPANYGSLLPLMPPDSDPSMEEFVRDAIAEMNLASELHERLLAGAKNELFNENLEPSLNLKKAAEFFAWLSHTQKKKLPRVVIAGLEGLGINRPSKKSGRPRGRRTDILYVARVREIMLRIGQRDVFSMKKQMRKKYSHRWRVPFMRSLEREGFPLEEIDILTTSSSLRAFATHMTASEFNVSYDAVDRACRRTAKAAKS
jgi:hypothetical protein